MIKESDVFKIGVLGKPHGIHGEISFLYESDIFDQDHLSFLILKVDGILVPFFIEEYRFKGKEVALITFQDIGSEEKALKLQGLEVFFPRSSFNQNEDSEDIIASWDFFIGFKAIDKNLGLLGEIRDVDTQTINTLFSISNDGDDEILIPAVEEFILDIDNKKKEIYLELPEGIID